MTHFCRQIGRAVPTLDDSAVRAMLSHPWPGNVRELRNTIERICYLTSGDIISASQLMLQSGIGPNVSGETREDRNLVLNMGEISDDCELGEATRVFQVAHIMSAIDVCRGNMTEAAARLGLHRSNLYRKMRQLGMPTSGQ